MTRLELPDPFPAGPFRLRPPAARDMASIVRACRDPDIVRWTPVPADYDADDARAFLLSAQRAIAEGDGAHLVVVDPADDGLLGAVGLSIAWPDLAGELGYWTAPWARGRGVATAAAHAVARFAFERLGLRRLSLRAAVGNAASARVAERLGFVPEGVLREAAVDGPAGDATAPRTDMRVHGLLPTELRPPP